MTTHAVIPPKKNRQLAFITCHEAKLPFYFPTHDEPDFLPTEPPFTPDDQLAVNCLRSHGLEVTPVEWGVEPSKLKDFDMVVMRSPWDYMDTDENRQRFDTWVQQLVQTGVLLQNKAQFIQWLLNKVYLKHFEQVGIPIVPSQVLQKGSVITQEFIFAQNKQVILKPCISGSGQGLFYVDSVESFQQQYEAICLALENNDYLLQPFIPEVKTHGEWSLIYLDGQYSHAVHKIPGEESILTHAEYGGTIRSKEPPQDVLTFGNQIMESLSRAFCYGTGLQEEEIPLYLRIDIIQSKEGPLLSECEGVEPELFFRAKQGSEELFVRGIQRRLSI